MPVAADTSGDEDDEEVMVDIQEKERRWATATWVDCDAKQEEGSEVWVKMDTKSDRWETQPLSADHVIRETDSLRTCHCRGKTYLVYSHHNIDSFQLCHSS